MTMPLWEQVITVALCIAATMLSRFLPFILFSSRRPTPRYIQYLGATLPAPIVFLHLWKRNMMISMAGGTAVYMFLVQMVFV